MLQRIGNNAYRLELPKKYGKLHHTFHVSLLELYRKRDGVEPPEPIDIDGEDEWEVEEILAERTKNGKKQYYVRWAGFSEAHDSWEPEQNLVNAREAVERFTQKKTWSKVGILKTVSHCAPFTRVARASRETCA